MTNVEQRSWTREQLRADVLDILRAKVEELDASLQGSLTEETRLLGDLDFESVTIVEFCMAIGRHFQKKKLPFQELVFRNGQFRDFTVAELVTFLEKHLQP